MKNLWGYLTAGIFAAISWALVEFAKAHGVLVDMIYPYVTRLIITFLADMTAGSAGLVWQTILGILIVLTIGTGVLVIWKKKNIIRWFGWVLATISFLALLNTALYDLNAYAGPLADDLRLNVADYTVTELNEAAVFFRDKANTLAKKAERNPDGSPNFGTFEEMAVQAAEGYKKLTYEETISVFAGSTAPVKKLGLGATKGKTGITVAITGEAAVNPKVPTAALPFAMNKEMAHRMTIYSDTDARFAAFLAGIHNPSKDFQYSAWLMAYYYCYEALASVPTSTAQACAAETDAGVNEFMRGDLEECREFFGTPKAEPSVRTAKETESTESTDPAPQVTFSEYNHVSDLLASWYIQNYILPLHQEEEEVFDPFDPTQVDLSGIANAKKEDE